MPYVVEVKRPCPDGHAEPLLQGDGCGWDGVAYHTPPCSVCDDRCEVVLYRRAVATIEEARERCRAEVVRQIGTKGWFGAAVHEQYESLPEAGGSVELPDGTTIRVETAGHRKLEDALGYHLGYPDGPVALLAAWNERNGITEGGQER